MTRPRIENKTLSQRVYAALSTGPMTISELAERVGVPPCRLRSVLRPMRDHHFVACTGKSWAIVPGSSAPGYKLPPRIDAPVKPRPKPVEPVPRWSPEAAADLWRALASVQR